VATRALVLGSGGLSGVAWEAGVLQGLAEAGDPVTGWGLVVGSSAGAVVGVNLLASGSPRPLFERQVATDVAAEETALRAVTGSFLVGMIRASRRPGMARLQRLGVIPLILRAAMTNAARDGLGELAAIPAAARSRRPGLPPEDAVAAMGRLARGVRTREAAWIDYWTRSLAPVEDWPEGPLVAVVLDIADGRRRGIDRAAGVTLARAVAATTSVGGLLPPIAIDGHRWMDGGTGSATNADLAAGFDEVLVIAPTDRGSLAGEIDGLRRSGSDVRVIRPSDASDRAMGQDLGRLDPARCAAAARAGLDDGRAGAMGGA
jgi:NTE family protein